APAFTLPFFNVRVDGLERFLVDDGAHVGGRIGRIRKLDLRRPLRNLVEHRVVNPLVDDRARTRGAFLSLETKSRLHYAGRRFVEIRIVGNDDRILTAHFRDDALDPELSVVNLRGALIDAQTN